MSTPNFTLVARALEDIVRREAEGDHFFAEMKIACRHGHRLLKQAAEDDESVELTACRIFLDGVAAGRWRPKRPELFTPDEDDHVEARSAE